VGEKGEKGDPGPQGPPGEGTGTLSADVAYLSAAIDYVSGQVDVNATDIAINVSNIDYLSGQIKGGYVGVKSTALPYNASLDDYLIVATTSGTVTIPSPTGIVGKRYEVKNLGGTAAIVSVSSDGGYLIDDADTADFSYRTAVSITALGTQWIIT
jgi:hypothetical protein